MNIEETDKIGRVLRGGSINKNDSTRYIQLAEPIMSEIWKKLKSKDTWLRVAEWMSYDHEKRKRGFKLFGMDKENELPFVITVVLTIITVIVMWLIINCIIPAKR